MAPNPAPDEIDVALTLARPASARVTVHDALGRELALLHAGYLPAGRHAISFDTGRMRAGRYFVRAAADGQAVVRPFVLAR